jgi:alkylation response protein AidB-like acyl-CoA dehydrogenase
MAVIWEPSLNEENRRYLEIAEKFALEHCRPLVEEIDRAQRYPWENVRAAHEIGLTRMFLPTEFGGGGASLTSAVVAIEAVARECPSTAAILTTYQLGAEVILHAGTPAQKKKYLAETVAKGDCVSFCLSELGAGSDPAGMTTSATPEKDGYRIRGEKFWVGNGTASLYYVVFAKTDPDAGARGITGFIVPKDAPGVAFDYMADKMGQRGSFTSNMKLDTWVPKDAIVGELNKGLSIALAGLDVGRVAIAGHALGMGMAAFDEAASRACARQTFGKPMIEHQGIGFKLADMAMRLSGARMMVYQAAQSFDQGQKIASLAAMTKVMATEAVQFACNEAVQIWGSMGYVKPTKVERLLRDQRINQIYEGASEIQRIVLTRAVKAAYSGRND